MVRAHSLCVKPSRTLARSATTRMLASRGAPGMRLAPSYAWLIATASALVLFAAGLTLTTWRPSATDRPAAARVSSSSSTDTALELVTLSHTATKDGLLVTGRIHNPDRASARRDLSVVVLLFDAQGLFLGSAQTDAGEPRLEPGASTTFAVAVPSRMAAARYRVSFRQGDAVVPHVDKRGDPKAATSTSARGAPAGVARDVMNARLGGDLECARPPARRRRPRRAAGVPVRRRPPG